MALTDLAIKKLVHESKSYRKVDEKGLYIHVHANGSKYWQFRYRFLGKQKLIQFGVYPEISLKEARAKRDDARVLLRDGVDPSEAKKLKKAAAIESHENSFESIATEWYLKKKGEWSKSHSDRTWRAMENDLFPVIGSRPILDLGPVDLLQALRKVEARGAIETAHRVKQVAGQVFRYAIATSRAERDPTPDLKGALSTPVGDHYASITDPKEIGPLLLNIDAYHGTFVVKTALILSPYLFCRPGELRHMEWDELKWDKCRWEIPAEKMKKKKAHIVPLSTQAIHHLKEIQPLTGKGRYVFPSARGASRPLSENGVRTALRSLGYANEQLTPHGFRAMARTVLDEELGYSPAWIDCQLAHSKKGKTKKAYDRTKYLAQREKMMQHWADYLDDLKEEARAKQPKFQ